MSFEKEFERNLKQLMQLLKKMMSQYPNIGKGEEASKFLKNQKDSPDVNIFFLNLAPLSPEELDELEEAFEENLLIEGLKAGEIRYELNGEDKEFLKKNGIRF